MQVYRQGEWVDAVESDLQDGEKIRILYGGVLSAHYVESIYKTPEEPEQIISVTVTLDKSSCLIGDTVAYTVTFSEPITINDVVPISVIDRNGVHVSNIGCNVNNGVATGTFNTNKAGDYTVTNEAINFHKNLIAANLVLTEQPWLRVYK